MAFSINGVGTTFYGSALKESDGSYVVTEWFVLAYIPIFPIESKRVWPVKDSRGFWSLELGSKFQAVKVPLHKPHLIKGYAVTVAALVVFLLIK